MAGVSSQCFVRQFAGRWLHGASTYHSAPNF